MSDFENADFELDDNVEYMDFDIVNVEMEDGTTMECEIDCVFPVDEKMYVALVPVSHLGNDCDELDESEEEGTNDEEVLIYHFEKLDDGRAAIYAIESEEEQQIVNAAYNHYVDFFFGEE